ncbi:MAG: hypothetical protein QM820_06340 [Minicystis sp.]
MKSMGAVGVPLPIMSGFRFVFADAVIETEEHYVSILANVERTS